VSAAAPSPASAQLQAPSPAPAQLQAQQRQMMKEELQAQMAEQLQEERKMMKEQMAEQLQAQTAQLQAQLQAQTATQLPAPPPHGMQSHDAVFSRIVQETGTMGSAVAWADFERAFTSIYLIEPPDALGSQSSHSDRTRQIRKTAARVTGFHGAVWGKKPASDGDVIARLRADMDTNGDGYINRAEWAHWHQRWMAAGEPPMAEYLAQKEKTAIEIVLEG
jgi:hypothetical protein